jgi:hypothetical protein
METNYMIAAGLRGTSREKIIKESAREKLSESYAEKEKERMEKERAETLKFSTTVQRYFKANIYLKTRHRDILLRRQIAHFFANELNIAAKATISDIIGGVDHATIYNSVKAVEKLMDVNLSISYAFSVRGRRIYKIETITKTFDESDSFVSLIDDLRAYLKQNGFTKRPIINQNA